MSYYVNVERDGDVTLYEFTSRREAERFFDHWRGTVVAGKYRAICMTERVTLPAPPDPGWE